MVTEKKSCTYPWKAPKQNKNKHTNLLQWKDKIRYLTWNYIRFKPDVCYFLFFHQMIALKELWKMLFISSKKSFFVREIFKFSCGCKRISTHSRLVRKWTLNLLAKLAYFLSFFFLLFYIFQIQRNKRKWNNL